MDMPTALKKDTETTTNDYVWCEELMKYVHILDLWICKSDKNLLQPTSLKLEMKVCKKNGSHVTLYFNNPTASFSTRWDVIYKTLLRDCRKYYADRFEMKKFKRSRQTNCLNREIEEFVISNFSEYNDHMQNEIKFYILWLIYPKEMVSNRVGVYDEDFNMLKGNERSKKIKKIKELHNYLYNFSMEKCEKFFWN